MPRTLQCLVAGGDHGRSPRFAAWLSAEGHAVSRAGGADSAVIQVARRPFDLLVLDADFGTEELARLLPVLRGATTNRAALIYLLHGGGKPLLMDELCCDGVLHLGGGRSALRSQLSRAGRLHALLSSLHGEDDQGFVAALRADPDLDLRCELFSLLSRSSQQALAEIKCEQLPGIPLEGTFSLQRPMADGRVRLLLADHRESEEPRIAASLVAQSFLAASSRLGMAELADSMHKRLKAQFGDAALVRASLVEVAADGYSARVYNAGMGPVLKVGAAPDDWYELPSRNAPLGGGGDGWRETRVESLTLAPHDRILLVDSAALNACNERGRSFGRAGLYRRLERNRFRGALMDELLTELHAHAPELVGTVVVEWRNHRPNEDRVAGKSMSAVSSSGLQPPKLPAESKAPMEPAPWQYRLEIGIDALRVLDPLCVVMDAAIEAPDLFDHAARFRTVTRELLENALEHGLKSDDAGGQLRLSLDYLGARRGRHRMRLVVEDTGTGFDHHAWIQGECCGDGLRGRGISIAQGLSDALTYHGCGNRVDAAFSWPLPIDNEFSPILAPPSMTRLPRH